RGRDRRVGQSRAELVVLHAAKPGGQAHDRSPEHRLLPHHFYVLSEGRNDHEGRGAAAHLLERYLAAGGLGEADGRSVHDRRWCHDSGRARTRRSTRHPNKLDGGARNCITSSSAVATVTSSCPRGPTKIG